MEKKDRVILHCDMNGFYASVELLAHPELKDKPVAVCGAPESRHGIILAKNELAKRCGVVTAETIWHSSFVLTEINILIIPSELMKSTFDLPTESNLSALTNLGWM